jgi:gliding motility-associated-like protein
VLVYPDINLMVMGDTVLCDPTPAPLSATTDIPATIIWTLNGDTIGMGSNIDFVPTNEGPTVITATATDPLTNCVETATVTVTYDPLENVIPESPFRICPGESTAINPGGRPNLRYEWAPADEAIDLSNPWNPVVTTRVDRSYSVTVTDEQRGCRIIAEIEILVEDEVGLDVTPEVSNHCEGVLSLSATTAIPATINWFLLPDNTPLGSGNALDFVPPLGTSLVYAEAVSAANCTERDTVTVNYYPINASITPDLLFCVPTDTTSLTITNNDPAQELTIVWEPTGVVTDPATGASVVVDPNITDSFTATVSNQFGCSAVFTTTVTVIDLEGDLSISAEPIDFLLGESTTITVSGCDDCFYEWFPPPGETVFPNDGPVVETTPVGDGELTYTVVVTKDGCEQTLSITLDVLNAICDTDHLFFPNAFTPNNDGDNDVLRLRSNFLDDLLEVEWMIYDRWGEEIFRTTDPRGEWDGTFRNEQLAPDVYGYWLRIVCPDEEELIQKGNVTLLR